MPPRTPDVPALAVSYRRLVSWVGIQLLAYFASGATSAFEPPPALGLFIGLTSVIAVLVTVVMVLITTYRTAQALGSSVPLLWVLGMFIPLFNVIFLLVLSSKATALCRAQGIPVGFFGPKLSTTVPASPAPLS
jgi:hypothetical protein